MRSELNPERRLLSCILMKPEIMPTVRGMVRSDDFVDTDMSRLYSGALRAESITIHTVVDSLPDRPSRKSNFLDLAIAVSEEAPQASDWRYWCYRLIENSERLKLEKLWRNLDRDRDLASALSTLSDFVRKSRARLVGARRALKEKK